MNSGSPVVSETRSRTRGLVRITSIVGLLTIAGLCLLTVQKQSRIDALEQEVAQREKPVAESVAHLEFELPPLVEVEAPVAECDTGAPVELQIIFQEMGLKYGIEPDLLAAIAKQESRFNYDALSPKGAQGLMGLMPITVRHLAERHNLIVDPWDPRQAIEGAAAYLQELQTRFDGVQVLAAYNMGPTALRRLDGDYSDIQETADYVETVSNTCGGTLPS